MGKRGVRLGAGTVVGVEEVGVSLDEVDGVPLPELSTLAAPSLRPGEDEGVHEALGLRPHGAVRVPGEGDEALRVGPVVAIFSPFGLLEKEGLGLVERVGEGPSAEAAVHEEALAGEVVHHEVALDLVRSTEGGGEPGEVSRARRFLFGDDDL